MFFSLHTVLSAFNKSTELLRSSRIRQQLDIDHHRGNVPSYWIVKKVKLPLVTGGLWKKPSTKLLPPWLNILYLPLVLLIYIKYLIEKIKVVFLWTSQIVAVVTAWALPSLKVGQNAHKLSLSWFPLFPLFCRLPHNNFYFGLLPSG